MNNENRGEKMGNVVGEKKFSSGKLPGIFKKRYRGKKFSKKLLSKLFIESDREFAESLFTEDENHIFKITEEREFTAEEIKRLKSIASQIKSQKGRIKIIKLAAFALCIALLMIGINTIKNPLVKKGLRSGLQSIFQAKADIDHVSLKFFDSSLTVKGIAVANKERPMENLFEIGTIVADFDLVQLLKGKFVAELAEATGITYGTERTVSGELPKKIETAKEKEKKEKFEKKKKELLKEFASRADAGIAEIMAQYDPEKFMENAVGSLRTPALKEELVSEIEEISSAWKTNIKDTSDEIKKFGSQAEEIISIDVKKIKNAKEIKELIEKTSSVIKSAKEIKTTAEDISKRFSEDTKKVESLTSKLQDSAKHDASFIKEQINSITGFDIEEGKRLISGCFDTMFVNILGKWYPLFQQGISKMKEFQRSGKTPEIKRAEKKKLIKRAEGRNVVYRSDLPSFLIRKIKLGGSSPDGKLEVKGDIMNITNDADLLGEPATADIIVKRNKYRETLNMTADFRKDPEGNAINALFTGGSYPLKFKIPYADGIKALPDLKGSGKITAEIFYDKNEKTAVEAEIELNPLFLTTEPFDPPFIFDTYSRVLASVNRTEFDLSFGYSENGGLDFSLRTTADKEIADGLKKVMNEELSSVKTKLRTAVNEKLEKVKEEFSENLKKYDSMKEETIENVDKAKRYITSLEEKKKEFEKETEKSIKKVLTDPKEAKDIKKKLKELF